MSILSGMLTARRFRVVAELPAQWRESFRDRLNEHAFQSATEELGKEEKEGWTQVHNLLNTQFDDFNRWLYGDYLVFALRVDKKVLPGKLLTATLEKQCEEWCSENGAQRCPALTKTALREELEQQWLRRVLPRVTITEAVWNIEQQYLILNSLSDGVMERFEKRFRRTFGYRLLPWSPLNLLADSDQVDALISSTPAPMTGGLA
ncbi:MAG: recombination-associated protein RdgC [Proteobacteria bacterium]|nr:recombination-associated protein RdgC [Pseudomonadota bacterium]